MNVAVSPLARADSTSPASSVASPAATPALPGPAIVAPNAGTPAGATKSANAPLASGRSQPRPDLYAPIHKALRHALSETLVRVGRLDVDDAGETAETLTGLDGLLDLCRSHVEHEDAFIHPAIEARLPEGAARTADDHVEHLASIDALRAEGRALPTAGPAERALLALRLYRHLALFVAENLQHMHIEETVNNAALWAHYSDAELFQLHARLLAAIPPRDHLDVLRWMVPALTPAERAETLNGAKRGMPPEAFLGVVAHVRPSLDARAWSKLAPAIDVALQPALSATA